MKRRFAALLLAGWMLPLPCAALTATGLETESVTREWAKNAFFTRMEALTGVQVTGQEVTQEKDWQTLLSGLEKRERPADILFKANLSREEEQRLLDAGAILDLAPLIDAHMPNLSALLAEHPAWRSAMTLADGRIASLPMLNPHERQVCLYINAAWLRQCNLAMPQSVEELTQALRTLKDADPNGNGKADEIGAALTGVWEMRWLLPYFGIVADDANLAREKDGTLVFAPELPAYRSFVETLAAWTREGILPADAFTVTHGEQALAQEAEESTRAFFLSLSPYGGAPLSAVQDYEALLIPGPDGEVCWRDLAGAVWPGCMALVSGCASPEDALRWADALYAEAGAALLYAGAEEEDYAWNADGSWRFLTDDRRTIETIRRDSILYTGVTPPGLYPWDFMQLADSAPDRWVSAQSERARAVAQRVLPYVALSPERQQEADALTATLGKLVDEGIARFATGEVPLTDETWAAWLAGLKAAGSDRLIALYE